MRKSILLIIAVLCIFTLVSCSSSNEEDETESSELTGVVENSEASMIEKQEEESSQYEPIRPRPVHTDEVSVKREESSEIIEEESSEIAPHEHSFSGWKTITQPTCTKQGEQEHSCTECGEIETRATDATGHNFGDWTTTVSPTCTKGGQQERSCLICGAKDSRNTDAAGHSWSDWKVTKEATTSTTGEQVRSCSVCGASETGIIDVIVLSASDKLAMARVVAQQIANSIPAGSDIDRVGQAAYMVSEYCNQATYTTEGSDYSTAYGVFIKGEYSCAGATRALGLVLECMGYRWEHVNENQWTHQWCRLTMDGQVGYADGQVGWVGYGKHPVEE